MNKTTAIIVDDEKSSRIVLTELINKYCSEVSIVSIARNIEEAYSEIIQNKPDIVFLDIQMPGGNSFSLLKKFEVIPFQIIFITSHSQYALNAIKFSALDYILKPVDIEELKIAVRKAIIEKEKSKQIHIVNLINTLDPTVEEKKILVHKNENVHLINILSIMYIEGNNSYTNIMTAEKEKFTSTKMLKDFEEYFSSKSHFIRIHRETIVNIDHIKHYSKTDPCFICMKDEKEFEISRRKKNEILEILKRKPGS